MIKKTSSIFLCFILTLFFVPTIANAEILKKGFHKVIEVNTSPDATYTVQNTSFNERIYMLIFDAQATPLQGIRLKPQSVKYNLVPLKPGYKIVLIGDGEINISPNLTIS